MEQHPARSTGATSTTGPSSTTEPAVCPATGPALGGVSVPISFITGETQSELLDGLLLFDPADPYAVDMQLEARAGTITWTFARELLAEGLYEPTGQGDVQVWPCLNASGEAVVIIELISPDGVGVLQASSRRVQEFVSRTVELVPLGTEDTHLPIDDLIGQLLGS